jgi:hypothetical protein
VLEDYDKIFYPSLTIQSKCASLQGRVKPNV